MPVFFAVIGFFSRRGDFSAETILGSLSFSAMFSIAAFFWGALLTPHFRISEDKKPHSLIIVCFLWGCAITALTMFTTGFFLGLIESIKHMKLSMKAIEYGLFVWGFGSIFTFGILYVVGGAAGVITGLFFRRIAS
jgi:cell shape-determining protein MreD